jgi:glycerate kinase
MARAIGAEFYDDSGNELYHGGEALARIARIDTSGLDGRLEDVEVIGACDVDNFLLGARGAAAAYGPQKGADEEMVDVLEAGLENFAARLEADVSIDVRDILRGGSAGGVGAALHAFCSANLSRGTDIVLQAIGFDEALNEADLVIVGEGKLDANTLSGKAPSVVAGRAKSAGVPHVACICGVVEGDVTEYHDDGIDWVYSTISRAQDEEDSIEQAEAHIEAIVKDMLREKYDGQ